MSSERWVGMSKEDKRIAKTLLVEAHRVVASEAKQALEKLSDLSRSKRKPPIDAVPVRLSYPPEGDASREAALQGVKLTASQRAGLEALIADACAGTLFQFLCLIDGVGDPELSRGPLWLGAKLGARTGDADMEMLHDQFFETWWEYKRRARSSKKA